MSSQRNDPPFRVEHPFETDRLNGAGDFRLEWDVPAVGMDISTALADDVDTVRMHPAPDPARKIHVLMGPSGYGKTHLFGRVQSREGDNIVNVFTPLTHEPSRIVSHIQWSVVEALFQPPPDDIAPISRLLAKLIAPSFAEYLDQLTPTWQAKVSSVRQRLQRDSLTVLSLLTTNELGPYLQLAESIRQRHPHLAAGVVRALVLGLSVGADDARAWLRGEAEQVPDERLNRLRLPQASPDATLVLKTVATMLTHIKTPLLLCIDQIEWLLQKDAIAFRDLTAALMAWLQDVPNLIIVLGCIKERWIDLAQQGTYQAFLGRIKRWDLRHLKPHEAGELVTRRMDTWVGTTDGRASGWPFDMASVEGFAEKVAPMPRGLIEHCRTAFDKWIVEGATGLIKLSAQQRS